MIQVKNDIIRNPQLSSSAFTLYVAIIYLYFNKPVVIYKEKLLSYLHWKTNKKLKSNLQKLYSNNLLVENYDKLPKFKPLILTPLSIICSGDAFTQLPPELLTKKLQLIGDEGLRLLYYYKSFINGDSQYAYPSIDVIMVDTGMSNKTIVKYNKILYEHRLLHIDKFELGESQNEYGYTFNKFNNHYYVLVENFSKDFKNKKR